MDRWKWAVILRVVGCELSAHNSAGGAERSGAAKLAAETMDCDKAGCRGEVVEKSEAVNNGCDW